jgi:D-arabinose 5-phosphate isomerase GutQ
MNAAKNAGSHNFLVTAEPKSSAGLFADSVIIVPAQTTASDHENLRPAYGLGL